MHSTQTTSSPNTQLQTLLERATFLQLTTSTQAFPHSKGEGLPIIRVTTPLCSAFIALQGAHLLSFSTPNEKPLLWLSPNCNFTKGVALRGGIPLCLPWFGVHPQDATKPKHGFARNRDWELSDAILLEDGSAKLTFSFDSPANALFDFSFTAQLNMILGKNITLELTLTNCDQQAFDCSWVMHNYFPIDSLANARVTGLAGKTYLDNLEKHARKPQIGDVAFESEVDRVYPAVNNPLQIINAAAITIQHENCPSVVVWNPGKENAKNIGDIGAGNEQHFICVERGAVMDDLWRLNAGESKTATMCISHSV